MKTYFTEENTIQDLCNDKDIGKYMFYLYYPKRYLNEVYNLKVSQTATYGLEGFNFLKEKALEGKVKQYFVNKDKPDVSFLHIAHNNNAKVIFDLSGGGLYSVCHGIEGLPIASKL